MAITVTGSRVYSPPLPDGTVTAVKATAATAARAPTVVGQVLDASVTAVKATGTALAKPPTVAGASGTYTPDPTKIIFLGDYSTNNFNQWPLVQNVNHNNPGSTYTAPWPYPAAVVTDATYGHACRFELRDGDIPFSNTERTEVQADTNTGGANGDIRWYEFANKFDATFPNIASGFGVINQFHGDDGTSSPPVGWYIDHLSGNWSLTINRQSAPAVFLSTDIILNLPLDKGNWHHITMRIVWSTSDAVGSVQCWYDQVRQTFIGGSQTYATRTLVGGGTGAYYKEGVYRNASNTATAIMWHTGFRCCSDKTGLTWAVP